MNIAESIFLYAIITASTLLLILMTLLLNKWQTRKMHMIISKMEATDKAIADLLAYHKNNSSLNDAPSSIEDDAFKALYILYKKNEQQLICSIESILPKEKYHHHCTETIDFDAIDNDISILINNKRYLEKAIAVYNNIKTTFNGTDQKRMNMELVVQWYYYYAPFLNHPQTDNHTYQLANAFRE